MDDPAYAPSKKRTRRRITESHDGPPYFDILLDRIVGFGRLSSALIKLLNEHNLGIWHASAAGPRSYRNIPPSWMADSLTSLKGKMVKNISAPEPSSRDVLSIVGVMDY